MDIIYDMLNDDYVICFLIKLMAQRLPKRQIMGESIKLGKTWS